MARANNFWFEFAGVSSVTNGLKLLALPNRPKPELRIGDPVIIPGRDDELYKTANNYKPFDLTVRCETLPTTNMANKNATQISPSETCGVSGAANSNDGITVTATATGVYLRAAYYLGSVADLGLVGKRIAVRCGGFTETGTGAGGIFSIQAWSKDHNTWYQTIYEIDAPVDGTTFTVPAGLPLDAVLEMHLFVSKDVSAAIGASVEYTNILIEVGTTMQMLSAKRDTISAWLTGRGVLRFSDATERSYKAFVIKQFDYEQMNGCATRNVFEITFRCQPCKYVYPIPQLTLSNLVPITNPGTRYAEPVITIVGSGDIMLTIGTRTLTITGLASQITLDMEARVAYNGNTNLGAIVSGDWPLIVDPGVNNVLISGTVTSVTMVTNWRYI